VTASDCSFGRRLRDERERRTLTLDAIAESTKINASLLAGLERDDLSRWPSGIFRRAFVREYAIAIGLSPDAVLAEFLRHFPEDGTPNPRDPVPGAQDLRLTFAIERSAFSAPLIFGRAVASLIELLVVCATGALFARAFDANLWTMCGLVGLIYYPTVLTVFGTSAALWLARGLGNPVRRRVRTAPAVNTRDRLQLVARSPQARSERPAVAPDTSAVTQSSSETQRAAG
jgi:transcriptional regulator with XRE-family HTH domain